MIFTARIAVVVLVLSIMIVSIAYANLGATSLWPTSVQSLVTGSDVIVEAQVTAVHFGTVTDAATQLDLPEVPPGVYSFTVLNAIKGQLTGNIAMSIPALYGFPYDYALAPPSDGDVVLLFLCRDGSVWVPTSTVTPFFPISITSSKHFTGIDARSSVLADLCNSLDDPKYTKVLSHALASAIDPNVVLAMSKYVTSADPAIKDNALTCMIANSQFSAIPMVAAFVNAGNQGLCVFELGSLTSHDAVTYLNPLVWDRNKYVRLNAMRALVNIADQSSAPYLILALRDVLTNYEIAVMARGALAVHVLKLKQPYEDRRQFIANYSSEVQTYYDWWSDELLGKHASGTANGTYNPVADTVPNQNFTRADILDHQLLQTSSAVREAASTALLGAARASSIPYLILSLQDPDVNVAYNGYLTLRRLLKLSSPLVRKDAFVSNMGSATDSIYAWWHNYLSDW